MRTDNHAVVRVQRYHPALDAGHVLTARVSSRQHPVEVHLRQSLIDGACAHHVVGMALVILGVVKRSAILEQSKRKYGYAAALWHALSKTWFEGVHVGELYAALFDLDLPIALDASDGFDRGVDAFVVDALTRAHLTLTAYEAVRDRSHRHWVLCVGVSALQIGSALAVDGLLVLDPSSDALSFSSHNARLQAPKPIDFSRRKKSVLWRYETAPQGVVTVRLMGAISVRLQSDTFSKARRA